MDFNGDAYRYHVVFTDMDRNTFEVFTGMSVMLNLGETMAVIMVPQYPEEVLEVAVLDIDENAVIPMRNGDILVNEREWFLQGRFMYPQEDIAPEEEEEEEEEDEDMEEDPMDI